MRRVNTATVAIGTASLLTLGMGVAVAATVATPAAAPRATSGGVKIAYYTQWSMYQNAFYPKNLVTEGIAAKTDIIDYAFENIDPINLTCFETTKATNPDPGGENDPNAGDGAEDEWADYQKGFDASISVDGVGDTYNQPLAGQFNQLRKLKAKYPNLKILLSLGGWTYSKYFSDAASTDASRRKLASSCIDMFIKGNLPVHDGVHGGLGVAAGIFDGFDIDWEYPGVVGHLGNHVSPNDKQNYTLLLAEFRRELDALGGGHKYLTAALPAGQDKIAQVETDKIAQYLDYGNPMTYDMHGAWEATGPTNHQSGVYTSPNDPMTPVPPGSGRYSVDAAVQAYLVGAPTYGIPGGFPASKLTVGYPMYYRGWTGVPAGSNHGLYQSATGGAPGSPLSGNVPGVSFYKELKGFVDNPAYTFWDPQAQATYFYNGTTFWSGEDTRSIQAKANYQHCQGLAGAMVYSLEDDDPSTTLYNAIVNAVNGGTPGCSSPPTTSPTPTVPPTGSPTPTPPPTGGGCTAPAWSATAVYTGGAAVSYTGHQYTAKWWTQGDRPDINTGDGKPWTDNGPCSGGGPTPTPPPTGGPGPTPTPTGNGQYPAWQSNHAYAVGDQTSYGGHDYQCLQAHTSLPGWEPPNVPALWKALN